MKNSFDVTGNVVADGELKDVGQTKVLKFRIAENVYYKGEEHEPNYWVCEAWGKLAESLAVRAKKGVIVHLQGEMHQNVYTPKGAEHPVRVSVLRVDQADLFTGRVKAGGSDGGGTQEDSYAEEDYEF